MTQKPILVSIVGPTAVGKTSLSIALAEKYNAEIISADSRQLYREMNIGTAKPENDQLAKVKHHFINSHAVSEDYSAGEFGRDAVACIEKLHQNSRLVLAVGGSTLYLKSLWEGFDHIPEVDPTVREQLNVELKANGLKPLVAELGKTDPKYYQEVDLNNHQRVIRALEIIRGTSQAFSSFRRNKKAIRSYQNIKIGLEVSRELLYERINQRVDEMMDKGLMAEVKSLLKLRHHNALQTVGYQEIFGYLDGLYDETEAIRLLKRNTRRYAKRQVTWFKKYDDIHWYRPDQTEEIIQLINSSLSR